MDLTELAAQYRKSGELCRERCVELARSLKYDELSETQRLLLRRRITVVASMAREAIATSNYLARYYTHSRGRRVTYKPRRGRYGQAV